MNIDYRIKNLENLWNNLNNQTKKPLIIYIYKDLNIIEVEIIDNSYLENTFWENK